MHRICSILVISTALVGCSETPEAPESLPPVAEEHLSGDWQISMTRAGDPTDIVVESGAFEDQAVSVLHGFGPVPVYPDGEGPDAEGEISVSRAGDGYWVSVEAPNVRENPDSGMGSSASLRLHRQFTKSAEGATLELIVSESLLEVIDHNTSRSVADDCPWRSGTYSLEIECGKVLHGTVSFDLVAVSGDVGSAPDVPFFQVGGTAALFGYLAAGDWRFDALTTNGSAVPLWSLTDFERNAQAGPGSTADQARMRLLSPITIDIPLDPVPVGATFSVTSTVEVRASNQRQAESYVSAHFRDPAKTGGLSIRYDGLESIRATGGLLAVNRAVQPAPPCTVSGESSGVIAFDTATYLEPELPGQRARIVVTRTGGSDGLVSARFATADGSAVAGTDYTAVSTHVLFADGELGSRVVEVPILADTVPGPDRTVQLTLAEPMGCATLGSPATADLIIMDDDSPPVVETYTVGGTVTGLAGTGLRLADTRGGRLSPGNGSFTFPNQYAIGDTYTVRVDAQPTQPIQVCSVTNGNGTIRGLDVVDVEVDCVTTTPNDSLDVGFGDEGRVAEGDLRGANDVALQIDGKALAVGGNILARYDTDGTLDADFGSGGQVTTSFFDNGDELTAVALQPDGRIVVAGYTDLEIGRGVDWAIARYDTDGNLDPTFGTGGIVTLDFGAGNDGNDLARDVLIQPDGRIVVVGIARTSLFDNDFAVARYTSAGELDASFGNGGVVTTNIAGHTDLPSSAVLQPDGKIVVGGRVAFGGGDNPDIGLVRYHPDGTLDASFGTNGIVRPITDEWDEIRGIALQPDGKIVFTGLKIFLGLGQPLRFMIGRYNADGSYDISFGGTDPLITEFSTLGDQGQAVAVLDDGRIVAVGEASNQSNSNFAIARYHPDGTLDADFGTDGIMTVDFFGSGDRALAIAIHDDGRMLVGGWAYNQSDQGVGLVRVLP